MKENKKSSKGLTILIIILIICVLGLGGYIVYDKVFDNNKQLSNINSSSLSSTTEKTQNLDDFNEIVTIVKKECGNEILLAAVSMNNKLSLIYGNKKIDVINLAIKNIKFVEDPIACDYNKLLILTEDGKLYYSTSIYYDMQKKLDNEQINITDLENTKEIADNIKSLGEIIDNEKGISINVNTKENDEIKNISLIEYD